MQTTVLTFAGAHLHGELLPNLFRARYDAFIEKRGWDLPHVNGMEYDQYDTPASIWIAAHVGQEVRAGIRLTPTMHRCGHYTYMIKDAQDGRIDTLPADLLHDTAPVSPDVWEITRAFVGESQSFRERIEAQHAIATAMVEAGRAYGAKDLIGITPSSWPRFGLDARVAGPVMEMSDGKFQCVFIDTKKMTHSEKRC